MSVRSITSSDDFRRTIGAQNLVVVDFFATWCGPCKKIAPVIEQFSNVYPEVTFVKVNESECPDVIQSCGITAFPTFHFYIAGRKVQEIRGADAGAIEQAIRTHKVAGMLSGTGNVLGTWDGTGLPPALNAREARLRAFNDIDAKKSTSSSSSSSTSSSSAVKNAILSADENDDEEIARAIALSMNPASVEGGGSQQVAKGEAISPSESQSEAIKAAQDSADQAEAEAAFAAEEGSVCDPGMIQRQFGDGEDGGMSVDGEELVPVPVDESILAQLIEMGFPDVRARKGIVHGKNLDGAVSWLSEHLDDEDIDQPYLVKKSDAVPKVPLTAEEKALRIAQTKAKIVERREEKARLEKQEEIRREKERRSRGQQLDETQQIRDNLARKREAEKAKREKDEAKRERERLRLEIARDKEARRANKGVLPSVLGKDGYNPSAVQYDVTGADEGEAMAVPDSAPSSSALSAAKAVSASSTMPSTQAPVKKAVLSSSSSSSSSAAVADPERVIATSIETIMRYRTGGDGGQAIKLLITFLKNILENRDETKYRSINYESKAFKAKLTPLVGPVTILKALGFVKNETEGKFVLEGGPDFELLSSTHDKLFAADALYQQQNPL